MFMQGGKLEIGWQGVFNPALFQMSESQRVSALLAAAISTQSLIQPLQRLEE